MSSGNEMEQFFYGDEIYDDIGDLMDKLDFDEECNDVPDDWNAKCYKSSLEPIVKISAEWIVDQIDEERFTEDGDEAIKIYNLLKDIDFTIVNEKMPKIYYLTRASFILTKQDLIDYCK